MLFSIYQKALSDAPITKEEAMTVASIPLENLSELFSYADRMRREKRGDTADLCSITNAKSGACPENCGFCAQGSKAKSGIKTYPLLKQDELIDRAKEARDFGAKRFCIVISGKKASPDELRDIAKMVEGVRSIGLLPCATLGLLYKDELQMLKSAGLERYHHNLETSRRFFPEVCNAHSYDDKLRTLDAVLEAGLSLCSGGIFGLGEDWGDRVDMALELRAKGAESIPLNFLIPVEGTRYQDAGTLSPFEALKIVSLYRFIMPDREIRLCGGRAQTLGEFNSMVFMAGADGLLIGNYLTTTGRTVADDMKIMTASGIAKG